MTRVDFYLVESTEAESCFVVACRVAEKAFQAGHRVHINTASENEARRMNDVLWTFRPGSFLPHEMCDEAQTPDSPVTIGHGFSAPPADTRQVLLNLSLAVPPYYRAFERVAEIVGIDEPSKEAGRQRYKAYRDDGCQLQLHTVQA